MFNFFAENRSKIVQILEWRWMLQGKCYVIISNLAISLVFHHFGEQAQGIRLRLPDRFSPGGARGLDTRLGGRQAYECALIRSIIWPSGEGSFDKSLVLQCRWVCFLRNDITKVAEVLFLDSSRRYSSLTPTCTCTRMTSVRTLKMFYHKGTSSSLMIPHWQWTFVLAKKRGWLIQASIHNKCWHIHTCFNTFCFEVSWLFQASIHN